MKGIFNFEKTKHDARTSRSFQIRGSACARDCNGVSLCSAFCSQSFSFGGALPCGAVQEPAARFRCITTFLSGDVDVPLASAWKDRHVAAIPLKK
ncbi:hypothetical protein ACFX15_033066 [Malus domestica]